MPITTKDIVIILLGIIGSAIFWLLLDEASIIKIKDYTRIGILIVLSIVAIMYVIYKKFDEIDKELENQKLEQKRIDEKVKIYERLAILEKRIFDNGYKS